MSKDAGDLPELSLLFKQIKGFLPSDAWHELKGGSIQVFETVSGKTRFRLTAADGQVLYEVAYTDEKLRYIKRMLPVPTQLADASAQQVVPGQMLFTRLNRIFSEDQIAELSAWYERQVSAGKSRKRIQIELLGQILDLLWASIQISFDNLWLPKNAIKKVEK